MVYTESDANLPLGHEYFGNICTGFGAPAECDHRDENGNRCGQSPVAHSMRFHKLFEELVTLSNPNNGDVNDLMDATTPEGSCMNCGGPIVTMTYLGERHCSEFCKKDLEARDANQS